MDRECTLVEARNRLGGRILSLSDSGKHYDLGPAWYWNGQPRMAALVSELGLHSFSQHTAGEQLFEDENGRLFRGLGMAPMEGSFRIDGGFGTVISAMASGLPRDSLRLNDEAVSIEDLDNEVAVHLASGKTLRASQVVLALPPRLAARLIYTPELPEVTQQLSAVPTWMAGHAKVLALYNDPFWRENGLSGDAFSRTGPLAEIHDASPAEGGPFALFGFSGTAPAERLDQDRLRRDAIAQITRLFGRDAGEPANVLIQDWSTEPFTAVARDAEPLHSHPVYGLPEKLTRFWGDRLLLSGTETSNSSGGLLEGALEAAEIAFERLSTPVDLAERSA